MAAAPPTLAELRAIPPCQPPSDFAEHWRQRYVKALRIEPAIRLKPRLQLRPRLRLNSRPRLAEHTVHAVEFLSTDGRTLGGWVALPKRGPARWGLVHSHGYTGRATIEPAFLQPDGAAIWPVARGLPVASLSADLPPDPYKHVLVGIESRDSYILGGCTEDVWCAASALLSLIGDVPLAYAGTSFGGGVGALALPWDPRFVAGALVVPSFGQYDLRLATPCEGSGEAVRRHVAEHPDAREVLRYFDASSAATFLEIPMSVTCARVDPAVPAPGQWAVRNAIPHATGCVITAGHSTYPGEAEERAAWEQHVREFLATHVREPKV